MSQFKVFLSSTYKDLLQEREIAKNVIARLQQQYVGMEFFPASDETPIEVCQNHVDSANIVILIIGHRYGFVSKVHNKSIVELEFERAIAQGKRVLVFIKSNESLIPASHFEEKPESISKLRKFKKNLSNHYHVITYKSPEQFESELFYSLYPLVSDLNDYPDVSDSKVRQFKSFWKNFSHGITVIMEASEKSPHSGTYEGGKNINGAIGIMELLPVLAKLGISYKLEASSNTYINKSGHLIIDGSPGGNRITRDLCTREKTRQYIGFENYHCPQTYGRTLRSFDGKLTFDTQYRYVKYSEADTEKKEIKYDYGLLCSLPNPFDSHANCLICSGNHGYGTFACMKLISDPKLFADLMNNGTNPHFRAIVGISPGTLLNYKTIDVHHFEIIKAED